MQRILPLLAAQARPRLIGEPVSAFADEVTAALQTKPDSKLVVFPELHLFGDGSPDQQRTEALQDSAEPLDGPRIKELQQLAADLGIWLVPGSVCERGPEGQLFNTQLVLSRRGSWPATTGRSSRGARSSRTIPATGSPPWTWPASAGWA
jgi:predicted amidohydrolase